MKTVRLVAVVIVFLVVLGVAVGRYLLGPEPVPADTRYVIDVERLRALAREPDGPLPLRVNHEVVAIATLPRVAVFAGESFEPHRMVHGIYQVVYPEGFLVIDAGFGRGYFDESLADGEGQYDAEAFERVIAALEAADTIVLTHEHGDHIEGLAHVADPAALGGRVVFNAAQHASDQTRALLPDALLEAARPVPGEAARAVAPGVVLLPAPGHTPGSQIVYVLLEDGAERLFVGDVAWHLDALRNLHYRPRLVTDWFLDEDRDAVLQQFRALHALLDGDGPVVVVSHDAEQRRDLVRAGGLGDGLE